MGAACVQLLKNYPKCSQDLIPIEVAWRELKARLETTMHASFESRAQFITRLHNATARVNANRFEYLYHLCMCQKEWARDVKNASPPGSRASH